MFREVQVKNGKLLGGRFLKNGVDKDSLQFVRNIGVIANLKGEAADCSVQIPDGEYILWFRRFGVSQISEFYAGCVLYMLAA